MCECFCLNVEPFVVAFVFGEVLEVLGEHTVCEEGHWGGLVLQCVVLVDLSNREILSFIVKLARQS